MGPVELENVNFLFDGESEQFQNNISRLYMIVRIIARIVVIKTSLRSASSFEILS